MTTHSVLEFDWFFISYDEPNAEKNWALLLDKVPHAKRVHGVKGFDSAHRACGDQAETNRLFTVDGDTVINDNFFSESIDISEDNEDHVFSWSSINAVNNLAYGNGGLKLWPKEIISNLSSHEFANNTNEAVDFCWDINYNQMNDTVGITYPNASNFQAFRAGFREGVKMSLDQGHKVKPEEFRFKIYSGNMKRLQVWMTIGADVDNGYWSMYGARLGCYMVNLTDWDWAQIKDYDWFEKFWKQHSNLTEKGVKRKMNTIGKEIRTRLKINVADLQPRESALFKDLWQNPERKGLMYKENE